MAGGLGTRLRPLTLSTPKSLLPVAGRPVIDRLLEKLAEAGLQDVTLATGYLAEQIEDFVKSGERWGLRVDYVRQVQPMGTAGALWMLKDRHSDILVLNGDKVIESAVDIARVVEAAEKRAWGDVIVGTVPYTMEVPCGVVRRDKDGHFIQEKPTRTFKKTVAGIYVMNPGSLRSDRLGITGWSPCIPALFLNMDEVLRAKTIWPVPLRGYVLDIGTPESYKAACATLSS